MSKLRAGIIGCGGIAQVHAAGYKNIPQKVELVACCDIVEDKVLAFSEKWRVSGRYIEYEEMLAKEYLDIVSICTPNDRHVEPVIKSAEAKVKGIFCEKPMALNLGDADRMIEACDRNGVKLSIDHSMRFEANYLKIKKLVDDGEIGDLRRMEVLYSGDQGTLPHNGTHACDALRFYCGDVDWIIACVDRRNNRESVIMNLHFKNGVQGMFLSGGQMDYRYEGIILEGSKGKIEAYNYKGWQPRMRMWRCEKGVDDFRDGQPLEAVESDPFGEGIKELVQCIEGNKESISNGREGRAGLELVMAGYESERQGRVKIKLPLEMKESPLELMLESGQLPRIWARELGRLS